jgi:glycosyltransferase involved in cell wall biosynthesis
MSLAMLESLSYGVPVVSTPVSGAKEVLTENKCGIVCNSFSADELAKSVISIIDNQSIFESMSMNAFSAVKNKFNIENMVNNHYNMYETIQKRKIGNVCAE